MAQRSGNKLQRDISSIRFTKNDRKEYARLVKNTKAKIRRTIKNYGIDLSNEISIPSLESFTTRTQFNEWKNKQSSFTNRANTHFQFKKNQYGVVASKHLLNEIERNTKKAQELFEKVEKEHANKPFITNKGVVGTVGQRMLQMGKPNMAGINKPNDFEFERVKTQRDLMRRLENIKKRSNPQYFDKRMETMKNNFITVLEFSYHSSADDLVDKIRNMPADHFYEMYLMFDEFDFDRYDSENVGGIAEADNLYKLESYIDTYYGGDVDFDLKSFPNR